MNSLDDLMEVWRSQDAAPLHGVNETLLRLALRQDEARLQKQRRTERWIVYVASAAIVAAMAFFVGVMIYRKDVITGWTLVIPIAGVAAALFWGAALYVSHRAQSLREQRFGESLRDQVRRQIAQLEYQERRVVRLASVLVTQLPPFICVTAFLLASWQFNRKPFTEDGLLLASLIAVCAYSAATSAWQVRRSVQQDLTPRRRRLEALLKELDT